MSTVPLALALRSNPTRHGVEGAARLINCYAEELGGDAKSPLAIYPTEGLDPYLTPYDGGIKCLLATESYLYGVAGVKVFAIDVNDVVTIIGTLPLEAPCYMARNRRNPTTQVGLVSNGLYWTIENTTMTAVTDPDLQGPPTSIAVHDGYFILPINFGYYQITGEDNGTAIAATDVGRAQRNPDEILRCVPTETDIALFGSSSIEWHQNNPDSTATFPYTPVAHIDLGTVGTDAVAKINRDIVWVANDMTVRRMEGYNGSVISTAAVERAIGSLADKSSIKVFGWTVPDAGKTFVAVRSPKWCWVYDLDGGTGWHERESYNSNTWRVTDTVEWGGLLGGDATTGTLYRMSRTYHSEGGSDHVMTVQCPPVDASPFPLTIYWLFVDVLTGQGLNTPAQPQNETPRLLMSYSDDGGRNWSVERDASLGRQGQTRERVCFNRLGQMRRNGRTFRFRISAAVARAIYHAELGVTKDDA